MVEKKKENNPQIEKNNYNKNVSNVHLAKQPPKPLKQKTVTDFFKPITDKDYHRI